MVQGIGGPRVPSGPMAGIEDVQTLRTQVGTLSGTVAASDTPNWEQAATQLDGIRDSLAGIQGNNQLHELGGQDLQSILDVAEQVLEKAEKNKAAAGEWSILERVLQVLGYILFVIPGIKYTEKIQKEKDAAMEEAGKPIPMLQERVEQLRARIDPEKTKMEYFEVRGTSVPLHKPDSVEVTAGQDQMVETVSRHLLGHQELVRDDATGRIGGALDPDKISIRGKDGKELSTTEKAAMLKNFEAVGGELRLAESILSDGKISPTERDALARELVNAARSGATVDLKNADGLHGTDISLRNEKGKLVETVTRSDAATRSDFQYHRGGEIIPDSNPPRSFQSVIDEINGLGGLTWDYDGKFSELNGLLHQGFVADRESHNISPTMSFQQYKLQFAQFPLDDVSKDDIWWHDGEGDLTAPEWAFLHLRVSDLPESHIPHNLEFSYKGEDPPRKIKMMLPLDKRYDPNSDELREALEQHLIDKFNVPPHQEASYRNATVINSCRVGAEVIGKDSLLPKVENLGEAQIRMVLADANGDVRNPDGSILDVGENIEAARDLTVKVVNRNVMVSAFRSAAQRSGEAISDLLKVGIPDTQKLFLRQSNGVANADIVDGNVIGQGSVITRGQDVGAFGKCAPTSYFCGAIAGIGRTARDGLISLQKLGDPELATLGNKIESLMTASPLTEATQQQLTKALEQLQAKARTAPNGAVGEAIGRAHDSLAQVKTSIVDRMVVKVDDEGAYFEMTFFLPPLGPRGDGYISGGELAEYRKNAGAMTVKVRPEDVQEYLEWTNRKDEYRGNKRHMMDFFKDPRSLNTAELLGSMGVGLVAVGVDKALKNAGKASGLLYGPSSRVVGPMVYNRAMDVDTFNFDSGADAFKTLNKKLEDAPNSDIENALSALANLRKDNPVTDANRQEFLDKFNEIREKRDEVRKEIFDTIRASSNDNAKLYVDYIEQNLNAGYKDYEHPNLWRTGIPGLERIIDSDPDLKSIKKDFDWFATDMQLDALEERINEVATDVANQKEKVLQGLLATREKGGAVALTMGFDPDNYHVNYLQSWGTPTVGGTEVGAIDLARSHMNHAEIGAMASAWMNDRAVQIAFTMNASKIAQGFQGILDKLSADNADGKHDARIAECEEFVDRANDVHQKYKDYKRWGNTRSERENYQQFLRDLEADTMDWFQNHLVIDNTDGAINKDNVVLMISNTERDNRVHDDVRDRDTVARGNIGDQKRGTSNALDAAYFVPLDMMATGFNNFDPGKARQYAGAEAGDSFALLSSMEVMRPTGNLEVALS